MRVKSEGLNQERGRKREKKKNGLEGKKGRTTWENEKKKMESSNINRQSDV